MLQRASQWSSKLAVYAVTQNDLSRIKEVLQESSRNMAEKVPFLMFASLGIATAVLDNVRMQISSLLDVNYLQLKQMKPIPKAVGIILSYRQLKFECESRHTSGLSMEGILMLLVCLL